MPLHIEGGVCSTPPSVVSAAGNHGTRFNPLGTRVTRGTFLRGVFVHKENAAVGVLESVEYDHFTRCTHTHHPLFLHEEQPIGAEAGEVQVVGNHGDTHPFPTPQIFHIGSGWKTSQKQGSGNQPVHVEDAGVLCPGANKAQKGLRTRPGCCGGYA